MIVEKKSVKIIALQVHRAVYPFILGTGQQHARVSQTACIYQ